MAYAITISPYGNEDRNVVLVKKNPARVGLVMADMSNIPKGATIIRARLHLHLHTGEGLAYSDTTSELAVYHNRRVWHINHVSWTHYDQGQRWSNPGGDAPDLIRRIRARQDIIDRGFHKHKPNAHFDFTNYVKRLQAER